MSCHGCVHFYVTHQPTWPYGCRAFGMRSRQHPARDVLVNSGKPCRMRQGQPVKEFSLKDVRS
ncbi:MAG: hypothetical protein EBU00_07345 [Alphaproteobacteria bacterium]|nr:hypothetical protein [Alphaproteobacteria bacterium]